MFGMIPNPRANTYGDVASALLLSLLAQTAFSLFAAAVPVLAPAVVAERRWNATIIALYPTIVYVTAFLVSFQVPELIFRAGGMGLSLVCVAGAAMGMMLLLLPYAAAAVLTSITIGCGTGAINPASAQVLGPRTTARTAGLVMSIKQTGVPLGGVLAGALVPVLTTRAGWHVAALALAVMGGVLVTALLPSARWLNSAGAAAKPAAFRPLDPLTNLLVMPGLPALLLASLTFNGMQLCLRSFFTVYLVTHQRLSLVSAGLAFSISQAAGMIGQVGWAALSDRLLSVRTVMAMIGTLMSAASFFTAAMTPDWPIGVTAIVAAIYGVSAAGYLPVLLGEVARRAPHGQIGALTSGAQLFPLAGCILGPLAFGGMAAILGMPAAFVLAGATTLAGAVILGAPDRLFAEWIAILKPSVGPLLRTLPRRFEQ